MVKYGLMHGVSLSFLFLKNFVRKFLSRYSIISPDNRSKNCNLDNITFVSISIRIFKFNFFYFISFFRFFNFSQQFQYPIVEIYFTTEWYRMQDHFSDSVAFFDKFIYFCLAFWEKKEKREGRGRKRKEERKRVQTSCQADQSATTSRSGRVKRVINFYADQIGRRGFVPRL